MDRYQRRLNAFWDEFATFSFQTAIKPLSFIHYSKFKLEAAMWFLVIGIFTGLTAWNVYETVEHYRRHETLTKINIRRSGEINYGHPIICVEYGCPDSYFATLSKKKQIAVLQQLNRISNLLDYVIAEASKLDRQFTLLHPYMPYDNAQTLAGSLEKTETFEGTLSTVIEAATGILTCASDIESMDNIYNGNCCETNRNTTVVIINTLRHISTFSYQGLNDELGAVYSRLIVEAGERLYELKDAVGSLLCHRMEITAGYVTGTEGNYLYTVERPCAMKNVLWLGATPFARMNTYYSDISSRLCVSVTLPNILLFSEVVTKSVHFQITPFSKEYFGYVDLSGDIVAKAGGARDLPNSDRLKLAVGTVTTALVSMLGSYKSYHGQNEVASTAFGFGDCSVRCMISAVISTCKCWPSTISRAFQTTEEGNLTNCVHFLVCRGKNNASENFPSRMVACQQATCNNVKDFRQIQLETSTEPFAKRPNNSAAILYPQNYVYPEFEEILAMDLRAFLSALGGSLSIYIGASFIAIIHIIVYILRSAYSFIAFGPSKKL